MLYKVVLTFESVDEILTSNQAPIKKNTIFSLNEQKINAQSVFRLDGIKDIAQVTHTWST